MAMSEATLIPPPLYVASLKLGAHAVTVRARLATAEARCPGCARPSAWVCSTRGASARSARVTVRRFSRGNPACPGAFAPGKGRRTARLAAILEAVAFAPAPPRADLPTGPGLRRGRLRPAQGAALWGGAGGSGAAPAHRPPARAVGGGCGRVATPAPQDRGRRPRPGRGYADGRAPGAAAGDPSGGPLPPAAQPRRRRAARSRRRARVCRRSGRRGATWSRPVTETRGSGVMSQFESADSRASIRVSHGISYPGAGGCR